MSKLLIVILLSFAVVSFAADFETTLKSVAEYDFGQDRQVLSEFSEILRTANSDAEKLAGYEKEMIAVLAADEGTFAAKQFLCKELSLIGTAESVPTLAKMLKNEEYADMARYALQRIPDASVDKALIKALKKSKGTVLVGIINSIGDRACSDATKALAKLTKNKDAMVQQAALAALGKIGTTASAQVLTKAVAETDGAVQLSALDAILKNADLLFDNGQTAEAQEIYELCADYYDTSAPVGGAALIGRIRTAADPTTVITEVLNSNTADLKMIAAAQIPDCSPKLDVVKIAALAEGLSPDVQIQLLTAFQNRGDAAAHPAVVKLVDSKDQDVRIAALTALSVLGNEQDIALLVDKAVTGSKEEVETAHFTLCRIHVPGFDQAVIDAVDDAVSRHKEELVTVVGDRKIFFAVDFMLKLAATDDNRRVQVAAIKTLGKIAQPKDIDALIDVLVNANGNAERREAERTLATIATSIPEKDKQGDAVLAAIPNVDDAVAKASLLQVAGKIGDTDALPVLQDAIASDDAELRKAAIRALSSWPNLEPFDVLYKIAAGKGDDTEKILAQRACFTLLTVETDKGAGDIADMYAKVLSITETAAEKRLALSGLSKVFDRKALELVIPYLDDPDTKSEAEIAVIQLSWRVRGARSPQLKEALKKIAETSIDDRMKSSAARMLENM